MHYLAAHPEEPFRLESLARHAGLSVSRLAHLFRVQLGVSPKRFTEKIRLDLARRLLERTDLSVAEVARVGEGEVRFTGWRRGGRGT